MEKIIVSQGRKELAALFKGIVVEIGVEQAFYSKMICEASPGVKLYGVDPLKAYKGYREHVSQEKLDGFYDKVLEIMRPYDFTFIRKFSLDAVNDFQDNSVDAVYIDGNHDYENVLADIMFWTRKVKSGGIVSGHDYIKRKGLEYMYGAVEAVNDYIARNNIPTLYIYKTGNRLYPGDRSPSWMFYKP
jgi:hypothetical protein